MASPFAGLAAEAHKLEADAIAIFHTDAAKVSAQVKANLTATRADIEAAIQNVDPAIKAAVLNAINALEKAALDALV
jgi:predicted dinucleotide-utilizing enzyme